jgi:hypothetical protein
VKSLLTRRDWLSLAWPLEVKTDQVLAGLLALSGLSTPRRRDALVLQIVAHAGQIEHQIGVLAERRDAVTRQLRQAIPGLRIDRMDPPQLNVRLARRVWLSTLRRPLRVDDSAVVAHGLLAALAGVRASEQLVVQWILGPVRRPLAVPVKTPGAHADTWALSLLRAPFGGRDDLDSEARQALIGKQGLPGWRAIGRIGVYAETRRRCFQLLGQASAALRVAQAPGVELGVRPTHPRHVQAVGLPFRRPLALNAAELVGLGAFPVGDTTNLPVSRAPSRLMAPSAQIPRRGRVVVDATFPGAERPLCLNSADALHHTHVLGPTGVGKSTLILNLAAQSMASGQSVVVVEPKGDLIEAVLARIPPSRMDDVVLIDPADAAPVGVNPIGSHRSPELATDQVVAIFRSLFPDSWGPRLSDVLTAATLTLARTPGMTVTALPHLLTNATFRRSITGKLDDPLGLTSFWAWYESISQGERTAAIAPVMTRLRAFLLRPQLRAVLGQAIPKLDIRSVFTERRILLVNLNKGVLGDETAALGSLIVAEIWHATKVRTSVEPSRRHPVMVFIDEVQDYLRTTTDIAGVLEQARGLGVGLTLSHQHLAQLTPSLRSAALANARSRICFSLSPEDAAVMAKTDERLTALDFQHLGAYEAYVRLMARGQGTPWASGRTRPAPPQTSDPDAVRQASRDRWGVPRADVEADLLRLMTIDKGQATVLGSRRRRGPGGSEGGQ